MAALQAEMIVWMWCQIPAYLHLKCNGIATPTNLSQDYSVNFSLIINIANLHWVLQHREKTPEKSALTPFCIWTER